MQNNHLWIIFLVIQFFSVLQVKGQDQQKDFISIPHVIQDIGNIQLQAVQISQQFVIPEFLNYNEGSREIPVNIRMVNFNFNRELKYLPALTGNSSFLLLPVYPALGDYQNFGGKLGSFGLTKKMALDYGAFISLQYGYIFATKQIVLGSNCLFRYDITNKLQFHAWGQYVTPGNSSDPIFNIRSFFPTTNFGAGLQYDSNEKTKIKVGIEYQYNQSDNTWKPESAGKVLLNF